MIIGKHSIWTFILIILAGCYLKVEIKKLDLYDWRMHQIWDQPLMIELISPGDLNYIYLNPPEDGNSVSPTETKQLQLSPANVDLNKLKNTKGIDGVD